MHGPSIWAFLAVNLVVVMVLAATAVRVRAAEPQQALTIENAFASVRYDAADGKLYIQPKRTGTSVVKQLTATLCPELTAAGDLKATRAQHNDELGAADTIEIRAADGSVQMIWLYPDHPFVYSRVSLNNKTSAARKFSKIVPLSCTVETNLPASDLKWFGSDDPCPASDDKTSYVFIALVDPKTRRGVVSGWVTHERASGIVAAKHGEHSSTIDARSEYGKLSVAPGA